MDRNADLIDLLHALNAEGARYLIVGGYAFALHGKSRATKDVDIFIGTDAGNASRVWRALQSFGAPLESLREEDLARPDTFFIMGREPNQIDIITTIDGITFEEAWDNRVSSNYGDDGGRTPTRPCGRRVPGGPIARSTLIVEEVWQHARVLPSAPA